MAEPTGSADLSQLPANSIDVAAAIRQQLPAPPAASTAAPTSLSPSQQSVVSNMGGMPNFQPIFTPTGQTNVASPLGGALTTFQNQSALDVASIARAGGAVGGAVSTQAAGIKEAADAAAAITSIKEAAARKVQEMDAVDRAQFGITGDGGAATIVGLSSAYRSNEAARQHLSDDIDRQLAIRFDQDPVGWLMKQFTLPGDIQQLARSEENVAQNLAVMKQINDLMTQRHADNELAAADHSVAMETAERALIYGQAKQKLGDALAESARMGVQLLNIRTAETRSQYDAVVTANQQNMQSTSNAINFTDLAARDQQIGMKQTELSLEQIKTNIALDANNRATEAQNLENTQRKLVIGTMEEQVAARDQMQARLNNAGIVFGVAPPSVQLYNQMTDSKLKAFWADAMADPNVQQGRYGFDVVTSLDRLNKSPVPPPPGIGLLQQKLNDEMANIIAPQKFTWNALPEVEKHQILENGLKAFITKQMQNVPDTGGIFSPGSLSSVLAIPYVSNTVLAKELKGIAVADPTHPLSAQEVMAAAATAMQTGKMNIGQAVDEITTIYNAAQVDANTKYNFQRLGFDGTNISTGFNTKLNFGGGFGSTGFVNMTNAGSVYDALTKLMIRQSIPSTAIVPPM